MRIKDRNTWPQGGWVFYQPQTGWWAPDPMSNSFNYQVANIIAHRRKNPRFNLALDPDTVAFDLEQYTCSRLNGNPQWCLPDASDVPNSPTEPDAQKKTSQSEPERSPGVVARLVAKARKLRDGERIITAWLGDSMAPVSQSLADTRAVTCLNCPKHNQGDWFSRVTGTVAEAVLEIARVKNALGLSATNESGLGTCEVCLCHMATKVWIPIHHIRDNTSPETLTELHANCWIKTETNE